MIENRRTVADALTGLPALVSVMTDDYPHVSRVKGRSASICAATSASVEGLPQATTGTPDGGTPSSRRRRPATRSQSARITSGRSIKRRVAIASNSNNTEIKSHCNSEPKLDQTETAPDASPNIRRKNSTKRGTSVYHRKSTAFLDVPDSRGGEEEDEDSYRLRSFSFTSKGKGKKKIVKLLPRIIKFIHFLTRNLKFPLALLYFNIITFKIVFYLY